MKRASLLLSMLLAATLFGCKPEDRTTDPQVAPKATSKSTVKTKPSISGTVSRIVFVDKEKGCACTRERIDKSWKALTDVVGYPPVPDVERIHMDSQADKAEPYKTQRAIMVPPALYFFDKQGKLVEVLQGEVKSEQVKKVLGT